VDTQLAKELITYAITILTLENTSFSNFLILKTKTAAVELHLGLLVFGFELITVKFGRTFLILGTFFVFKFRCRLQKLRLLLFFGRFEVNGMVELCNLQNGILGNLLCIMLGVTPLCHFTEEQLYEALFVKVYVKVVFFFFNELLNAIHNDLKEVFVEDIIVNDVFVHAADDGLGEGYKRIKIVTVLVLFDEYHHEVWIFGKS
jgi:hypothetical protein